MNKMFNKDEDYAEMKLFSIGDLIKYISDYPQITKRWFTPEELYLYITVETEHQKRLRSADYVGRIPYAKVGKMVRYDKEDIDEWLCLHKVHSVLNK